MPELRLNLITHEWVLISTERARRPEEFRQVRERKFVPEYVESCPFCRGNEAKTPDEISRIEEDGSWKVRVIPNKLAALSATGERVRGNEGLRHWASGVGRHEVIIETPRHDIDMARLEPQRVEDILRVYRERFNRIYEDPRVEHVIIFKNHGEHSGTTLRHPHSQIIGTPIIPFQIRERVDYCARHYDVSGKCLMCETLEDEYRDGARIILDTNHFVTFVPYAALSPFHLWVFPKRHSASFADITDEEIRDLAFTLQGALIRLYNGLENPDYNFVIRSESPKKHRSEYFHWYLSIVPRLIQSAGFSLGSGMYVNNSIPEEIADFLRKVKL